METFDKVTKKFEELDQIDKNDKSQLKNISLGVMHEFNKIIDNPTDQDFNSSHLSNKPKNYARGDDLDYYINENEYKELMKKKIIGFLSEDYWKLHSPMKMEMAYGSFHSIKNTRIYLMNPSTTSI